MRREDIKTREDVGVWLAEQHAAAPAKVEFARSFGLSIETVVKIATGRVRASYATCVKLGVADQIDDWSEPAKGNRPTPWTRADGALDMLSEMWAEGLSCSVIAARINAKYKTTFTRNAIIGKAHRLGLPERPSPINKTPSNSIYAVRRRRIRAGLPAYTADAQRLLDCPNADLIGDLLNAA